MPRLRSLLLTVLLFAVECGVSSCYHTVLPKAIMPVKRVKVGYGRSDQSGLLGAIAIVTLREFHIPVEVSFVSINSEYFGLGSLVDLRLVSMVDAARIINAPIPDAGKTCFKDFYNTFVSYWPAGFQVGDPTEGAETSQQGGKVAPSQDTPPKGKCDIRAIVPIFYNGIDSVKLEKALGFIAGELHYDDVIRMASSSPTSFQKVMRIAQDWYDSHA